MVLEDQSPKFRAFILYLFVFVCLLWLNKGMVLNAVTPVGDIAADMLQTNKIYDDGYLLVGHYSRWNFNHLGPFWFYLNYLFEIALDWTKISRFQIWLICSLFVNSLLITYCSLAFSKLFVKKLNFEFSVFFSVLCIGYIGYELMVVWMPYRLIMPYMAFLVACIEFYYVGFRRLPLVSFLLCALTHGYITMPFFTFAPFVLVFCARFFSVKEKFNDIKLCLIGSIFILIIFFIPIVVDVFFGENFYKILAAQEKMQSSHLYAGYFETLAVTASVLLSDNLLGWALLSGFLVVLARLGVVFFLKAHILVYALLLFVVLLAVFFYSGTPAPIYGFIMQFLVAVPVLALGLIASALWESSCSRLIRICSVCGLIFLLVSFSSPLKDPKVSSLPYLGDAVSFFAQELTYLAKDDGMATFGYSDKSLWDATAGLILELDSYGVPACVMDIDYELLVTEKHICKSDVLIPKFLLVYVSDCKDSCILVRGDYGVKRYALQKVMLGNVILFDSQLVEFRGWSSSEVGHRWSSGSDANIFLRLDSKDFILPQGRLSMNFGTLGEQEVIISINSHEIFHQFVKGEDIKIEQSFPKEWIVDGINHLNFRLPNARQPNEGNGDRRYLAIALKQLQLQ